MNKDDVYELLAGVALVALGYALWKNFKDKKAAPANFAASDPTKPDHGFGFDPYVPGEFIKLSDLLKGTVADVIHGQTAGDAFPTTKDLFGVVAAENTGTDYQPPTAPWNPKGAYW